MKPLAIIKKRHGEHFVLIGTEDQVLYHNSDYKLAVIFASTINNAISKEFQPKLNALEKAREILCVGIWYIRTGTSTISGMIDSEKYKNVHNELIRLDKCSNELRKALSLIS